MLTVLIIPVGLGLTGDALADSPDNTASTDNTVDNASSEYTVNNVSNVNTDNTANSEGTVNTGDTVNTVDSGDSDSSDCVAWSRNGEICGEQLPTYYLTEMDIPEEYQGFVFRTDNESGYVFEDTVFDDGFTQLTGSYNAQKAYAPNRYGATATLPDVGVYTDADGNTRAVTATMTVVDSNGGLIVKTNSASRLGLSGNRSQSTEMLANAWKPADTSLRAGIDVVVRFTWSDTGESVGDDFRGVTGFSDVDGNGAIDKAEGIEFISGFDAAYLSTPNSKMLPFGERGYYGDANNPSQADTTSELAQSVMVGVTFTGDTIRVRYSNGSSLDQHSVLFSTPLYSEQVRFDVHAAAVDETTGKTISTWTVSSGIPSGDEHTSTHRVINNYIYTGHDADSYPESGVVLKTDGERTIIYNYRPAYKLTYDKNAANATGSTANSVETEGSSEVSVRANGYTLEGYKFTGWNTEPDGTGTAYQPNGTFTLTEDSTLYAQWEIIPVTLTYNGNASNVSGDMTGDDATVDWNTTVDVAGSGYYREGYTFAGWNTAPDGTGEPYDPENPITLKQDTVLYAQWTINQITLTYDANHERATGETPSTTVDWNTTGIINANGYTVGGYRFTGWNTAPDGTGDSYQPDDPTMVLRTDTTVYAQWVPVMTQLPSTGVTTGVRTGIILLALLALFTVAPIVHKRAL